MKSFNTNVNVEKDTVGLTGKYEQFQMYDIFITLNLSGPHLRLAPVVLTSGCGLLGLMLQSSLPVQFKLQNITNNYRSVRTLWTSSELSAQLSSDQSLFEKVRIYFNQCKPRPVTRAPPVYVLCPIVVMLEVKFSIGFPLVKFSPSL